MKQADEAIEKVLAGLREVEAPSGMERRILQAAEDRAATRRAWGWRMPLVCGVALAMGVTALAVIHRVPPAAAPTVSVAAKVLPIVPAQPSVRLVKLVTVRPRKPAPVSQTADSLEASVMRDVLSPSFPAPPVPLTEQEKLLVRVAGGGQPKPFPMLETNPVAALDPDGMAQQEARTETQFQQLLVAHSADVEQLIEMMQRNGDKR